MTRVYVNPLLRPGATALSCLREDVFDGTVSDVGQVVEVFGGERHGLGAVESIDWKHQLLGLKVMWLDEKQPQSVDEVIRKLRRGLNG